MLLVMLMEFCEELSPFRTMKDLSNTRVSECDHLLDFLYNTIVPETSYKRSFGDPSNVKHFLSLVWNLLSKLNKGPVRLVKKFLYIQTC